MYQSIAFIIKSRLLKKAMIIKHTLMACSFQFDLAFEPNLRQNCFYHPNEKL